MAQLELFDRQGKKSSSPVEVAALFDKDPNAHLLYLAAVRQEANARAGTAHTKTKSEVRGGGAKPWKQKGTGRARAGSIRSPLWRGGGVMHGPLSSVNWTKGMNKKESSLALVSALSSAQRANKVSVIEELSAPEAKTKEISNLLSALGFAGKKVVFIESAESSNFELVSRAVRNIPNVILLAVDSLNVRDLLKADHIVFTKSALKETEARFEHMLVKE